MKHEEKGIMIKKQADNDSTYFVVLLDKVKINSR